MSSDNISKKDKGVKHYESYNPSKGQTLGWGDIIVNGTIENIYTSELIIEDWIVDPIRSLISLDSDKLRIVDFGGAAGGALSIAGKKISTKSDLYNIDVNTEAIFRGKEKYKNISFIESRLTTLPFSDNFFDIGYTRFVLQYNSLSEQEKIIQEIFRVMKNGSITVLIWPSVRDKKDFRVYTEFSNKIHGYIAGGKDYERTPTDPETVIDIAKHVGFSVLDSEELLRMKLTPEIFYDRFSEKMKMNGATLDGLKKIYDQYTTQYGEKVTGGSIWRLVLRK